MLCIDESRIIIGVILNCISGIQNSGLNKGLS